MSRTFKVIRDEDVSGVSGTGVILEGVRFSDSHVAIHWINSKYPWTTPVPEGIEALLEIHGHDGKTRLVWDDEQEPEEFTEEDIEFLHTVLSVPDDNLLNLHTRARSLLSKLRVSMRLRASS